MAAYHFVISKRKGEQQHLTSCRDYCSEVWSSSTGFYYQNATSCTPKLRYSARTYCTLVDKNNCMNFSL